MGPEYGGRPISGARQAGVAVVVSSSRRGPLRAWPTRIAPGCAEEYDEIAMADARAPRDAAAYLRSLDKEELVRIAMDDAKNWLAHDGLWFQAVEERHGMAAAIEADRAAWARFTAIEARRIMERLGMQPGGGILALLECLQHRLYARLNAQEVIEASDRRAVLVMRDCRVQSARARKGLAEFPCKSVGLVEYAEFARAVDARIRTACLVCPPDEHGPDRWCAWEFTIAAEDGR